MQEHLAIHPILDVFRPCLHPIRPSVRRLSGIGWRHELEPAMEPLPVTGKPLIRDLDNQLLVLVSREELQMNIQLIVNHHAIDD